METGVLSINEVAKQAGLANKLKQLLANNFVDSLSDNLLPKKAESAGIMVAGLCIVAADTGRVLMLQRAITEGDPASGKWEFPGGHIEDDETPLQAAKREFAEEIGCRPPATMSVRDAWRSGVYVGYVAVIPSEKDIRINKPAGRRYLNPDDPDGDRIETAAWWNKTDIRNNPTVRAELQKAYSDVRWSVAFALRSYLRGDTPKVATMNRFDVIESKLRTKVISKTAGLDLSQLKEAFSRLAEDVRNSPNFQKLRLDKTALRNIGIGAGVGGATGLSKSLLTNDGHAVRNSLLGALLGGAGGYGVGFLPQIPTQAEAETPVPLPPHADRYYIKNRSPLQPVPKSAALSQQAVKKLIPLLADKLKAVGVAGHNMITNPASRDIAAGGAMLAYGAGSHPGNGGLMNKVVDSANGVIGGGMVGDAAGQGIQNLAGKMRGRAGLIGKLIGAISKNGRSLGLLGGATAGGAASVMKPMSASPSVKTAGIVDQLSNILSDPNYRPMALGAAGALLGGAATTAGEALSHKNNKDYLTAALTGAVAGGGVGAGYGYLTRNGMSGILPANAGDSRDLSGIANAAKQDPALLSQLKKKSNDAPGVVKSTLTNLHNEQQASLPLADELAGGLAGAAGGAIAGNAASKYMAPHYDANVIDATLARKHNKMSLADYEKIMNSANSRIATSGPIMRGLDSGSREAFVHRPARLLRDVKNTSGKVSILSRLSALLQLGAHHGGKALANKKTSRPLVGGAGGVLGAYLLPKLIPGGDGAE